MTFNHDISPILLDLGPIAIRWYGLFFASGILINYYFTKWIFERQKKPLSHLDSVAIYLVLGLIIGARLGHILFYNFEYFSAHPWEIFQIWKGGLASHGAAIGVFLAYLLWTKKYKMNFSEYPSLLVLGMPITAGFVRLGNFFNSEIIGKPTDGSWGVIFLKLGEDFPRHPTQLYEAGLSFTIFLILFLIYRNYYSKLPKLFLFFLYMLLYFSTRFLVEFWKERHSAFENELPFSMGQILSIGPVVISIIYFLIVIFKKNQKNKHDKF